MHRLFTKLCSNMAGMMKIVLLLTIMLLVACAAKPRKVVEIPVGPDPATVKPVLTPQQQSLYQSGLDAVANGDLTKAKEVFSAISDLHPRLTGAHVNLALVALRQEDFDQARVHLDKAFAINPANTDALQLEANMLLKQGDFLAAEESLLKAVGVDTDLASAHYNLGVLYEIYLQDIDKAIEHFQQYVSLGKGQDLEIVERWIKLLERRR